MGSSGIPRDKITLKNKNICKDIFEKDYCEKNLNYFDENIDGKKYCRITSGWCKKNNTCPIGYENNEIINKKERTSEISNFEEKPCRRTKKKIGNIIDYKKKDCFIQKCPIDCKRISKPTEWSECSVTCGNNKKVIGKQFRIRKIIKNAEHGGNCKDTVETRKCTAPPCMKKDCE